MAKKKNLEWLACSESELFERIWEIQDDLVAGTVIALEGEMGAGKSAFARAILSRITKSPGAGGSPTFPLVQEYHGPGGLRILHVDLYRIDSEEELFESGILEQLEDRDVLLLLEWSSRFPSLMRTFLSPRAGRNVLLIEISIPSPEVREYRITRRVQS